MKVSATVWLVIANQEAYTPPSRIYAKQAEPYNVEVTRLVLGDDDDEVTVTGEEADVRKYLEFVGWGVAEGYEWVLRDRTLVNTMRAADAANR